MSAPLVPTDLLRLLSRDAAKCADAVLIRNLDRTLRAAFGLKHYPAPDALDPDVALLTRLSGSPSSARPKVPRPATAFPERPAPLNLCRFHTGVIAVYDPRCPWMFTPSAIIRRDVVLKHGTSAADGPVIEALKADIPFIAIRRAPGSTAEICQPMPWDAMLVAAFADVPLAVIPLGEHLVTAGGRGGLLSADQFPSPCSAEEEPEQHWARWEVFCGDLAWNIHVAKSWVDLFGAYPRIRFGLAELPHTQSANVVLFDSGDPIALLNCAYDRMDKYLFDGDEIYAAWSAYHRTWWGEPQRSHDSTYSGQPITPRATVEDDVLAAAENPSLIEEPEQRRP